MADQPNTYHDYPLRLTDSLPPETTRFFALVGDNSSFLEKALWHAIAGLDDVHRTPPKDRAQRDRHIQRTLDGVEHWLRERAEAMKNDGAAA